MALGYVCDGTRSGYGAEGVYDGKRRWWREDVYRGKSCSKQMGWKNVKSSSEAGRVGEYICGRVFIFEGVFWSWQEQ